MKLSTEEKVDYVYKMLRAVSHADRDGCYVVIPEGGVAGSCGSTPTIFRANLRQRQDSGSVLVWEDASFASFCPRHLTAGDVYDTSLNRYIGGHHLLFVDF